MSSNISGFPEFLPNEQIAFNKVVDIIKNKFELYGFAPIDTPSVEKISTLLSKGNDHEIYGIYRLAGDADNSKKELALRFDLTVPLARYMAQHYAHIIFPYRRYHIAPVWRGERPQAGRHRQFYQCDIDIIGDGELSALHDAEIIAVICDIFTSIGLDNFVVKVNNRNILVNLIQSFGISGDDNIANIIRIIDKAQKITQDVMKNELLALGLKNANISIIMDLITQTRTNAEWIGYLRTLSDLPEYHAAIDELLHTLELVKNFNVDDKYVRIDPSLARGLNYYTGTIYETILLDYPSLGTVCAGGRYGNLASQFTKKQLPGVGASIGISRLVPKLIESGFIKTDVHSPANVLVTTQNINFMPRYIEIARLLRLNNINTELYLQNKPLAAQMKYASKKAFQFVIIADAQEFESNQVIIRNMQNGDQTIYPIDRLLEFKI